MFQPVKNQTLKSFFIVTGFLLAALILNPSNFSHKPPAPAPPSKDATIKLTPQPSIAADAPIETVNFDTCRLEVWDANQDHPSFFVFKDRTQTLYRAEIPTTDTVKVVHTPGLATPVLTFPHAKHQFILLEQSHANGEYDYLLFQVARTVRKLSTKNSRWRLTLTTISAEPHLFLHATARLPEWGAHSVCPEISVLWRWNGHRFVYDRDAMRKQVLSLDPGLRTVIQQRFPEVDENTKDVTITLAPPELAEAVLTLYCSGQPAAAHRLYNDCWPPHHPGRKRYWHFLMHQVRTLDQWPIIRSVNRGS